MTFREMREKQVIQLETGTYLGRIDDLEFDPQTASIERFVLYGRPRLLGLMGREESLYVNREEVQNYGQDAMLVTTPLPKAAATRGWHWPWQK